MGLPGPGLTTMLDTLPVMAGLGEGPAGVAGGDAVPVVPAWCFGPTGNADGEDPLGGVLPVCGMMLASLRARLCA